MSYDIWLEIDTGGAEPAQIDTSRNMTSNVAPMWRKAGAELAEFHGRPAGEVLPLLRVAVAAMEDDPEPYRAMNPANGWGSYETCLGFLRDLVADFAAHPRATVVVSQ